MIYCFDLDNTLCATESNKYEQSEPITHRINIVNELHDNGHTIIIDTARGSTSGKNWWHFTLTQLIQWGVKFHHLRTGVKFGADVFIDDRALTDKDFFNDVTKK